MENAIWRDFFDGMFSLASLLLIVLFGAALGNVMRGVPLGADHYFFLPLWTNFLPGPNPGALDWYTVLCAVVTVAAVSVHGALYVILKTEGALNSRMRRIASAGVPALALLTLVSLAASIAVRPQLLDNYRVDAVGWMIPAAGGRGVNRNVALHAHRRERNAFLSSVPVHRVDAGGRGVRAVSGAAALVGDPANSLTIHNAASGAASLSIGLWWWGTGMAIAMGYFVLVYTMFRGKVSASAGHG